MAIELVSFENLKSILDLENDLVSDYPQLQVLHDSVVSSFESYTDRKFEEDKYVEKIFCSTGLRMVNLKAIPIDSIVSVVRNVDGVSTTLDSSEYEITDYGVRLVGYFVRGNVEVTYNGGIAEVDEDLSRAAMLQVSFEYQNIDHIGASSVSTEGGSVQRPAIGLLAEVKRLLTSFKHPGSFM